MTQIYVLESFEWLFGGKNESQTE